jgi:hypothetical protein
MKLFSEKNWPLRLIALAVFAAALPLLAGCGAPNGSVIDRERASSVLARRIAGFGAAPRIEFNDFYGRLMDEGRRWAGDKLRIGRISVGPSGTIGRSRGAAPVWLATIVRCDREEEADGAGKDAPKIRLCSGEARRVVMSNLNIDGYEVGFDLGKEESFYGSAVKPEQVKIAAAEAQRLADAAVGSQGADTGQYIYELTVRRDDGIPVWRVVKDCEPSAANDKCPESGLWMVTVNAESGETHTEDRTGPKVQE